MPRKSNIPNKIISFLKKNSSANRNEISDGIGVSYQAVQKHLRNLEKEGLVLPGFIVRHSQLKKEYKFWIMIETNCKTEFDIEDEYGKDYQRRLCNQIVDELLKNGNWSDDIVFNQIDIVFSSNWDIILSVLSENAETVGNFITQYLRTHQAISKTSTFWSPIDDPMTPIKQNRT